MSTSAMRAGVAGGVTPAAEPSLAEVGEGPGIEEAEVVAIGGTGQGAELARRSGRFFLRRHLDGRMPAPQHYRLFF